jgi:glucose-6-phosphate isomerase
MIFFKKNFFKKLNNQPKISIIKNYLKKLILEDNEILQSFKKSYKNNYNRLLVNSLQKYKTISVIGMGGSILGSKAIYSFLKKKNNKHFIFIDNLNSNLDKKIVEKKKLNLVISKSGNTLETIVNFNIAENRLDKNIFLTENDNSYLFKLANKFKSTIINHNQLIGGRFSVLSEVGMLPADLMEFKSNKFRRFDNVINNKKLLVSLIDGVLSQYNFIKTKKTNSVILNYDENSVDLFNWYQQLVAESLGKKKIGILPVISNMPKDNHSVMQNYLDGQRNNFFTFFYVKERVSNKIRDEKLNKSHEFLKKKNLEEVLYSQFTATQKVFDEKKIPYRTIIIQKRNEETLGELFIFFMLETILLGKLLKINPYDQPAVELIKQETIKLLKNFSS